MDGVTATYEIDGGGRRLLRSLSNTRAEPATVQVRLDGEGVARFGLLPFQKLVIYPPLIVAAEGRAAVR